LNRFDAAANAGAMKGRAGTYRFVPFFFPRNVPPRSCIEPSQGGRPPLRIAEYDGPTVTLVSSTE
jgi:hypothetical protein